MHIRLGEPQQARRPDIFEKVSIQAAWLNGSLVHPHGPHLSADDHGLVVGDGVFETMLVVPYPDFEFEQFYASRTSRGLSDIGHGSMSPDPTVAGQDTRPKMQAFAVKRHLDRLRRSASTMGFKCPYTDDEMRAAINLCLAAAPGAGLVRITATSGRGPLSSWRGQGPASVLVIAGDQPPHHEPGAAVAVMAFPRNERGAMAGVKTTSYAENVLALRMAVHKGASEAIFGDTRGRLSEGTGSNIFWVDGEKLCTPPLDTGCLAGVTRALIIEMFDVTERHLPVDDLPLVREAFLTSTTRPVQSIGSIDGVPLSVVDGQLTKQVMAAMADLTAIDIDP